MPEDLETLILPCNRRGLDYLSVRLFSGEEIGDGALEHNLVNARPLGDDVLVIAVPLEAA